MVGTGPWLGEYDPDLHPYSAPGQSHGGDSRGLQIPGPGFRPWVGDPLEAFAFVGTRYAYRTTQDMIDALRGDGYDDIAILDLAIAVAEANQWARIYRLLGLAPELFYVG